MRIPVLRLSLLTKILLSTSVAITVLFAITGQIVLHHITRTMSDSLEDEVHDSFRAYTSLWKAQGRAAVLGEPHHERACRTCGGVRHRRPRHHPGQRWAICGEDLRRDAFFLVTDPRGQSDRLAGRQDRLTLPVESCRRPPAVFRSRRTASSRRTAQLYHISVTPVYVQSTATRRR